MHGRALGSGAPSGKRNGRHKHGYMTRESILQLRYLLGLVIEMRALAKSLLGD